MDSRAARLITFEQITGVNLFSNINQVCVPAISDDQIAIVLKLFEIVLDFTSEKDKVAEGRLVDDHRNPLGFYSLHNTLDGRCAVITGALFHGQAVYADYRVFSAIGAELIDTG